MKLKQKYFIYLFSTLSVIYIILNEHILRIFIHSVSFIEGYQLINYEIISKDSICHATIYCSYRTRTNVDCCAFVSNFLSASVFVQPSICLPMSYVTTNAVCHTILNRQGTILKDENIKYKFIIGIHAYAKTRRLFVTKIIFVVLFLKDVCLSLQDCLLTNFEYKEIQAVHIESWKLFVFNSFCIQST